MGLGGLDLDAPDVGYGADGLPNRRSTMVPPDGASHLRRGRWSALHPAIQTHVNSV